MIYKNKLYILETEDGTILSQHWHIVRKEDFLRSKGWYFLRDNTYSNRDEAEQALRWLELAANGDIPRADSEFYTHILEFNPQIKEVEIMIDA